MAFWNDDFVLVGGMFAADQGEQDLFPDPSVVTAHPRSREVSGRRKGCFLHPGCQLFRKNPGKTIFASLDFFKEICYNLLRRLSKQMFIQVRGMATQKDIAREAGVSNSLVSYYLTGSKSARMSDETRKRIDAATRRLNYRPNRLARSLRTGKSKCIGMLISQISNPYFSHLAEEALKEARRLDYSLIPAMTSYNDQEIRATAEFLMRNRIDALFTCIGVGKLQECFDSVPILRPLYAAPGILTLRSNVDKAFVDAFLFFKSRGHSRVFGYYDKNMPWNDSLRSGAEQTGMTLDHRRICCSKDYEEVYHWIAAHRPGEIFLNGRTLDQVLNLLRTMEGYRPDIIIGVDEFHTYLESPLIVGGIQTSTAEMARRGIQILIERIENPNLPREGILEVPPGRFVDYTRQPIPVMVSVAPAQKTMDQKKC